MILQYIIAIYLIGMIVTPFHIWLNKDKELPPSIYILGSILWLRYWYFWWVGWFEMLFMIIESERNNDFKNNLGEDSEK